MHSNLLYRSFKLKRVGQGRSHKVKCFKFVFECKERKISSVTVQSDRQSSLHVLKHGRARVVRTVRVSERRFIIKLLGPHY